MRINQRFSFLRSKALQYEKITQSVNLHIAGKQVKKSANAKAINVKKSSYTLKVNKTATIKPTLVLEKKNKKAIEHVAKFPVTSELLKR